MPPAQADAYDAVVAGTHAKAGGPGAVLAALQSLRRVSLLPGDNLDEGITDARVEESARLRVLIDVLDQIAEAGEKS